MDYIEFALEVAGAKALTRALLFQGASLFCDNMQLVLEAHLLVKTLVIGTLRYVDIIATNEGVCYGFRVFVTTQ